jgi:hypothetical protein
MMPQEMPQQAQPQMPQAMPQAMPQQGGSPIMSLLRERLSQFTPEELQMFDVELGRASPKLLMFFSKLFPEAASALQVASKMHGQSEGMPMQPQGNPLTQPQSGLTTMQQV